MEYKYCSPEYLVEEVQKRYGITVPLDIAITYLDDNPLHTPDDLYYFVAQYTDTKSLIDSIFSCQQPKTESHLISTYTIVDLEKGLNNIPKYPGVYIWVLKDDAVLPSINGIEPNLKIARVIDTEFRVIYVGKAERESLYDRIIKMHLKGNPRRSTLCHSISAILGLPFYLKGKKRVKPGMDKQYWPDVQKWLINNCHLLYYYCNNIPEEERRMIELFTPPLNIKDNPACSTDKYIQALQVLRKNPNREIQPTTKKKGCLPFFLCLGLLTAILYVMSEL